MKKFKIYLIDRDHPIDTVECDFYAVNEKHQVDFFIFGNDSIETLVATVSPHSWNMVKEIK